MERELIQTYIVAGVVIKKDGKYLLVQEYNPARKDIHGLWNFPAGRVEKGATLEETAIKETKEESGYDVRLIRKLGVFQDNIGERPKHAFEAEIIGGELAWPKDEISDAKWFTWREIQNMKDKLRENWIIEAIKILENNKTN